jgi:hypothetical protein
MSPDCSSRAARGRFEQEKLDLEIVGVVANGKHITLGEEQRAALYMPFLQQAPELDVGFVFARTRGDPSMMLTMVRQAVGGLDRSMSVEVKPMQTALEFALLPSRIGAVVLGTLGVLGLVLAAFALYAIVSYTVSRRMGEIAIRSALGATRTGILRLVIRDMCILVGIGMVLGLGAAALVTAPLSTFLVEGSSTKDPLSFAVTGIVFLIVSVLASWLPARYAMRGNPAAAMRLD